MTLVKTDYCDIRKAKITLQCELKPAYYNYVAGIAVLNLDAIADALYDIEYDFLSPNGETVTMLSQVVAVGYKGSAMGRRDKAPRWLVIDLTEAGKRHESQIEWEEFLAEAAGKIVNQLAAGENNRIATVDCGDRRFVVMDELGGHNEADYILAY